MHIKTDDYQISYAPDTATVTMSGLLRLRDMVEYLPVTQLLNDVAAAEPPHLTLDMRQLQFLNSAGINAIYHFIFKLRNRGIQTITVRGDRRVTWQDKSLPTLLRLVPDVRLEWV